MARILVVDDDRLIRELLRLHLCAEGHSVVTAADATEAIRALLGREFDLVLADVQMPYLNGIELARAIRGDERTRHLPVIVLSALKDDRTWEEVTRLGARYLTKPVTTHDLHTAVRLALSARPQPRPAAALLPL